jgi:hypothetical protein
MQRENPSDSGLHSFPSDPVSTITLDDTQPNDKLVIKTRNSEYRFQVADPVSHKGMLSGGALGEEPREAYLIESLCKGEDGKLRASHELNAGDRALFYFSSRQGIQRVTTSEISSLRLVKGGGSGTQSDMSYKG